jgi:hypothetical protein
MICTHMTRVGAQADTTAAPSLHMPFNEILDFWKAELKSIKI